MNPDEKKLPPQPARRKPAAERVDSLFGQLQALEDAMMRAEQALLDGLDDPYATSTLAELREQHEALGQAASEVVKQIREHVENSSALAVFGTREETVRALAGEDSFPGIPPGRKPQPE